MRSTPNILKTTGAVLLVLSVACVPNFVIGDSYGAQHARERFVEDLEKRMTAEELTKMFAIPAGMSDFDRRVFVRSEMLKKYAPPSPAGTYLFFQTIAFGVGLLTLGILESRSRRRAAERALNPVIKSRCTTCGYDMSGIAPGTACPECAGTSQ